MDCGTFVSVFAYASTYLQILNGFQHLCALLKVMNKIIKIKIRAS